MTDRSNQPYRRVLLKLSGEVLMGKGQFGIEPAMIERLAGEIVELAQQKIQVGLVIGAGNFCRGANLAAIGFDRVTSDQIGMLATVMNALAMRDVLERMGKTTTIMSAIPMSGVVEHYDRRKAIHLLEQGHILIFAGGTGNPLVTTDSAASLRCVEIEADLLLKATNVDGVYTADPAKDPTATRYSHLTYDEALSKELGIMDLQAFCQCRDHNVKLKVFNIQRPGALLQVVQRDDEGTLVTT